MLLYKEIQYNYADTLIVQNCFLANIHRYFFSLDFDECANGYPCDQICTNTEGSFSCSCYEGYTLNGTMCNGQSVTMNVIKTIF